MTLKILHVSRPQVSAANQTVMRQRVQEMVNALGRLSVTPDVAVFSGDLSFGAQPVEFSLCEAIVIEPLMRVYGISAESIYVTPGVADIQEDTVDLLFQKGLRAELQNQHSPMDIWATGRFRHVSLERLAHYSHFVRQNRHSEINSSIKSGKRIVLVGLNSVWACNRNSDYSGFITMGQLDEVRSLLTGENSDLIVGFWHHSIEELDNTDKNRVKIPFEQMFDLCLTSAGRNGSGLDSLYRNIIPGRSLGGSSDEHGFQLIELDAVARTARVSNLGWNRRQSIFEVDSVQELPLAHRTNLEPKAIATQDQLRSLGYQKSIERLDRHLPTIQAGKHQLTVEERFLEPHLTTTIEGREKHVRIQDLIKDHRNYIIEGMVQSGKTALLDFLEAKISGTTQVAFRINFLQISDKHGKKKGLLDLLLINKSEFSRRRLQQILAANVTLLIDNATLRYEDPRWVVINSWCEDISHIRIIAAGRKNIVSESTEKFSNRWILCELNPLSLMNIKAEVSRLEKKIADGRTVTSLSSFVETLIQAELPRWPWVILILFELARNSTAMEISNLAMLVQRYVELRLRNAEDKDTSSAVKLLTRMLHLISDRMMKRREDFLYRADVIAIIKTDLSECGIIEDADSLFDTLLDSKVIFMAAQRVSFAFFVLQEYFYAEHIRDSRSAEIAALSADDMIRYGGALALLAEKAIVPELLVRGFDLAEKIAPNSRKTVAMENLSALEQALGNLSTHDTLQRARQVAEKSQQNLEHDLAVREQASAGAKLRRLQSGAAELSKLLNFSQLLCVSTAILRSSTFVGFDIKKRAIVRALDLSVAYIAEFIHNEDLTEYVVSTLKIDIEPKLKRDFAAVFSVILVIAVGYIVTPPPHSPQWSIFPASWLMSAPDTAISGVQSRLQVA